MKSILGQFARTLFQILAFSGRTARVVALFATAPLWIPVAVLVTTVRHVRRQRRFIKAVRT